MSDQPLEAVVTTNEDQAGPRRVTAEEYMAQYAELGYEWKQGVLVKMAPITDQHDEISKYLRTVLDTYLVLNPIGITRADPFVMKIGDSRRQPDIQVVLHPNTANLTRTMMDGAADICVEIVSEGNPEADYGIKFAEYEEAGVQEYWLIDPIRRNAFFYRLGDNGLYSQIVLVDEVYYITPRLPRFRLNVTILWQDVLPNVVQIVTRVQADWEALAE